MQFVDKLKGFFKRGRSVSLEKRKARAGYLFVLPFIIGIVAVYLPILIDSAWFSFFDLKTTTTGVELTKPVTGPLEYYTKALSTEAFTNALWSSLQELVFQVPAILVFSLFIAVILNQKMLGRAAFRAIFFVPVILSTGLMEAISLQDVASDMQESTMDGALSGSGQEGSSSAGELFSAMDMAVLLNYLPVGSSLVTFVVTLVNSVFDIVNYSGVQMLIFLAGLQSISPAIYEACQIEGATAWETFWKVTFPMISPMILVNAFYTIIDAFTRESSAVMVYVNSDQLRADLSQQAAMSWIYFLIVFLIIAVIGGVLSSFIFYQRRD